MKFKETKKVLITGGRGFVGTNLSYYLKKNGIDFSFLSIRADTKLDSSVLNGYQTIVHLSGKAHDLKKSSLYQEYYEANFSTTKKLFDVFVRSDASKFVFISSVKAVSDNPGNIIMTEDHFPDPVTDYGKTKLLAEKYVLSQPITNDKRCYILRPCMIHGPGNKGNLNLLYKMAVTGLPFPLGAFDNQRSFLTVENLCFVICQLITRDIASGIYNIADETPLSITRLMEIISEETAKPSRILHVNKKIILLLARLGDILHFPFNSERLKKLTENYVISSDKLTEALKCKLPVSAEDGLRNTIKSFAHDL